MPNSQIPKDAQTWGWDWVKIPFEIHEQTPLPADDFERVMSESLRWKKVVSFGEEHNLNADTSFKEIKRFSQLIFLMFRMYKEEKRYGWGFREVVEHLWKNEELFLELTWLLEVVSQAHKKIWNLKLSSTRVFAGNILAMAHVEGFTDIVFEGFQENNIAENYTRSKDKVWFLLIVFFSMFYNLDLHWVYDDLPVFWFMKWAWLFEQKVDEILEKKPEAKILTYNWGIHSMTEPILWTQKMYWVDLELWKLTFAPRFHERFWGDFSSIDLIDGFWHTEHSLFYSLLKKKAKRWQILIVEHSKWQKAIVFPKRDEKDVAEDVKHIIDHD